MKIFAKRSKKKISTPAISNEADKAVIEALTKNPEDLNAKERRLIKRYQDRINKEQTEVGDKNDAGATPTINQVITGQGCTETDDPEEEKDGSAENEMEASGSDRMVDNEKDDVSNSQTQPESEGRQEDVSGPNQVATDDLDEVEVKKLLDQLNSKCKRKLSRQLERDGVSALKAVREEALKLIEEMKEMDNSVVVEKVQTMKSKSEPFVVPTTKKRKRDDRSGLPPEERLRREEQRRKQQEAAERRAGGEASIPLKKHKHPLNSERRRANRRKPKWLKAPKADNPNDHDISGFQMRKITKKS